MAGERVLSTPPWKQGEDAALALRHRLHLGDSPLNIWEVVRRLGVLLALHDLGPDGSDGAYLSKGGRQLIIVNTDRRISRQRLTAAHELGHHEMHRHTKGTVVLDDPDIFGRTNDPLEEAANSFAGNLLAPAAAIADGLGDKRDKDIAPEDVIRLMGQFGMSYEATCNRLRNAELIGLPMRRALVDAGKGNVEWMLREAGIQEDAMFPPGRPLPDDYTEHAETLWKHRHISDVRLAEMLRLEPDELQQWIQSRNLTRPELPEPRDEGVEELLKELG